MSERALIELLYGGSAHANSLASVENVPVALAGRRVEGFPQSIAQLVWHMNYWMDYELKRIAGESPQYPKHAAESWPQDPEPSSEQEWNDMVARFRGLLGKLETLAKSGEEPLSRNVEATNHSHAKYASAARDVLWQTLVHNTYHVGQIVMLRRIFGAWPPPGGGDTW